MFYKSISWTVGLFSILGLSIDSGGVLLGGSGYTGRYANRSLRITNRFASHYVPHTNRYARQPSCRSTRVLRPQHQEPLRHTRSPQQPHGRKTSQLIVYNFWSAAFKHTGYPTRPPHPAPPSPSRPNRRRHCAHSGPRSSAEGGVTERSASTRSLGSTRAPDCANV